jgi:NOL1/NOP2/fmu family ribosome biogenesis protein
MKSINILNAKEIKAIREKLDIEFGFSDELPYHFILNTKNNLYIIDRSLQEDHIKNLRIDTIGLYFGELYNNELRLSIEGSQIIGPKAKKNILDISDEEVTQWMKGDDIELGTDAPAGFVLIKNKDDYLGCGKIIQGKLRSFISKARKLKVVNA